MNRNHFHKKNLLSPYSSNSVIWDGEDLPCISLCASDSVSEVTFKLATEICNIKKAYDLKDIDLKTVFAACIGCPQPEKTLKVVLQLIINKIASIDDIIKNLGSLSGSTDEPQIVLAGCFLPRTDSNGDPVTKLPHSDYTRLIAQLVCSMLTTVNGAISRVEILEEDVAQILTILNELGGEAKVSPSCVASTNTPIAVSAAFILLEVQFCELRKSLGLPATLLAGISKQPTDLKDQEQLSGTGLMSSMTGWKGEVKTVADSLHNLWLTEMDIRGAVKAIQDNCCKVNCDSIVIDFSVKLNDERTQATFFFASKSKIPVGFTDCDALGNKLVISDSAGNSTTVRVKLATVTKFSEVGGIMTEPSIVVDLGSTAIDSRLDYRFDMEACLTNGSLTCQKCVTKEATFKDTCAYCEISVSVHGGSSDGSLTIIYED